MSYKSPIDVIMERMNISYENGICKAVQNAGIDVDKNELRKALRYDRGQYQKGYADRDSEIIRCKDCKCGDLVKWKEVVTCKGEDHPLDWFCADGVAKDINVPDKGGR